MGDRLKLETSFFFDWRRQPRYTAHSFKVINIRLVCLNDRNIGSNQNNAKKRVKSNHWNHQSPISYERKENYNLFPKSLIHMEYSGASGGSEDPTCPHPSFGCAFWTTNRKLARDVFLLAACFERPIGSCHVALLTSCAFRTTNKKQPRGVISRRSGNRLSCAWSFRRNIPSTPEVTNNLRYWKWIKVVSIWSYAGKQKLYIIYTSVETGKWSIILQLRFTGAATWETNTTAYIADTLKFIEEKLRTIVHITSYVNDYCSFVRDIVTNTIRQKIMATTVGIVMLFYSPRPKNELQIP